MIFKKAQSDDIFDNETDSKTKAGEMAHWFRVLAALVQDEALIPRAT